MSVIAVKKYPDVIEIAADQQATWGDNKDLSTTKIIENNGMVIGACGTSYELSLMQIYTRTHLMEEISEASLLDYLSDFVDWAKGKDSSFNTRNSYIWAAEGKVFTCNGLWVTEVHDFNAIGSGMWLALGALSMLASPEAAVETAIKYDLYCGGGIQSIKIPISSKKKKS